MPHLRFELGLLLLKSLNSFHQEGDLPEGQESRYVRGAHSHHPAVLIQHLGAVGQCKDNDLQGFAGWFLTISEAPPLVYVP